MNNYLALSVLVGSIGLFACDSVKGNKVIFIPEESRAVYINTVLLEKFTKPPLEGMEIEDHGEITEFYWKAPFALSGKKVSVGDYTFEVAEVKAMDVKVKPHLIVVSDDECFTTKGNTSSVEFHVSSKNKFKDLKNTYFYKVTSPLDDKASIVKNDSTKVSCFFITNVKLYNKDPVVNVLSQNQRLEKTSLYVVNRETWFIPLDGAPLSLFYTHTTSDNWINISEIPDNSFEQGSPLSLGNLYYLGK